MEFRINIPVQWSVSRSCQNSNIELNGTSELSDVELSGVDCIIPNKVGVHFHCLASTHMVDCNFSLAIVVFCCPYTMMRIFPAPQVVFLETRRVVVFLNETHSFVSVPTVYLEKFT